MIDGRRSTVLVLAALLLLAAAVRFWGLSYGLPHPLARPDEEIIVGHSLELSLGGVDDRDAFQYPELLYFRDPVRGRTIAPGVGFAYPYPDLVYDLNGLVFAAWRKAGQWLGVFADDPAFIEHLALRQPSAAYLIPRAVTALCGTATVLAAFLAGWWAYGRRSTALLAALLVAVNFLHARDSHYATVDVPMALMVTFALAFAVKAAASARRRDVLLSAAFVGLAASAKFNGAVVALATGLAAAKRVFDPASTRGRLRILWVLGLAGALAIGVFALTSPWCITYAKTVHLGLRIQRRVLFDSPGPPGALVFLTGTLPNAFGWPGFVAALAGAARACWKRRTADLVFLVFLIPAFASMAGITWVLPRYPILLIPALAVLAADTSLALIARRPTWVSVAVCAALLVPPLARIIQYDRLATRADTRLLAADWIASHVRARARIAVCRGYGAPVVNTDDRRPPAFERILLLPCSADTLRQAAPDYVVTHDHPVIEYFAPTDDARQWLEMHARPVATFSPFHGREPLAVSCFYAGDAFYLPVCGFDAVDRGGPNITVWSVPR